MRTTPISLAYFSNAQARGGAEEHILTLLRGLRRDYFRVLLICSPAVAAQLSGDLPPDVELVSLELCRATNIASALALAQLLKRHRVEILHTHLFYSTLFAAPVAKTVSVPLVIETPHVRESWRHGWKGHYSIDRLIGRCVDYYIAVSDANARYLVEEKKLPAQKVRVIHNGTDLQRFHSSRPLRPELRDELGYDAGDPILLVVGRLEPQKGHKVLLDAMPSIVREFPAARLVCLGSGALRQHLEHQTRSLGLERNVRFIGFHRNVEDWIGLATLTVLPSFFEGLPLVAIESLAVGRTVVATAVDGSAEVVVDGKTGLLVPPGDSSSLARAICLLLRDSALRERLASAGPGWVRQRFCQERQLQKTQDLYFEALTKVGRWDQPVPAFVNQMACGAELAARCGDK